MPNAFSVALCYHSFMSQPVKLSDDLVLDARLAGEIVKRSIAGQVEFWATLGRSMESLLNGRQALALSRSGTAQPLSKLLETADSPAGRERVDAALERQPFPHYRPHPGKRGLLERVEADGTRTVGRFVQREFQAVRIRAKVTAGAK
jgi:ParD-like antitoxin of type II bacterial toxin-antitoxin system